MGTARQCDCYSQGEREMRNGAGNQAHLSPRPPRVWKTLTERVRCADEAGRVLCGRGELDGADGDGGRDSRAMVEGAK